MKSFVLLLTFFLFAALVQAQSDSPLTPEQALAASRLAPGLRIELVAAEPMVVDPVALAFDEKGRMYVVEDRGNPTGPGPGKPPAGIIALVEDTDGDGRFEKRTVFADGLTFPNGVMPWKGGVFVTCAPDLLYLKDTDGDGRADVRRVVFTGFATTGNTQLYVNHPPLGEIDEARIIPALAKIAARDAKDGEGDEANGISDEGRRNCFHQTRVLRLPSRRKLAVKSFKKSGKSLSGQ